MKRLNMLLCASVVSLSALLLLGCTTSLQANSEKTAPPTNTTAIVVSTKANNTPLTEQEAIDKVIKDNPHFPAKAGSTEYTEKIGGKEAKPCNITYTTKIEANGKSAFYVTLTQTWDTKIKGETPVIYTKYNVTKDNAVIVDSKTDFAYLNSMK